MIITRTPYRISFFGGGSDYPEWYKENGGKVISTTIDKYCYLTCRYLPPFFNHKTRILYSKIETVDSVEKIKHPAVRAALQELKIFRGVEIHHDGDLPARSGMGSSSAFAVGILHALHALKGEIRSKHELAKEAIILEHKILHEKVGIQDQIAAAHGGFNIIHIRKEGSYEVNPLVISSVRLKTLKNHLMLFYTGITRNSSNIARTYVDSLKIKKQTIRRFMQMVEEAVEILNEGEITNFGDLLHEAWIYKRSLGEKVSSPQIDQIYEKARKLGATGGKLLGAGGGGFLLLFAPPTMHATIAKSLSPLIQIPVDFENTGSQIIFYDRDQEYSESPK